jgi:glycerate dehydrogenase
MNPGDLNWAELEALADECRIYDRTVPEQTVQRALDAEIILTNKTVLGRAEIEALPKLRYIGVLATGINVVDMPAAMEHAVTVTNVPAYSTTSVAQLVLAFMLHFARKVAHHADAVRAGRWCSAPDFCFWDTPQMELNGKTLGVVGFGQIGRTVVRLGTALGMKTLAAVRRPGSAEGQVREVGLDELFEQSDFISLHCPLTDQTQHVVNRARLQQMKQTAFLINTGRGGLVDEEALAEALRDGQLAGAGLDVLSSEPPPEDNPLLLAPNCVITPHLAWAAYESRQRLYQVAVDNIKAFLQGSPINVCKIMGE